MAGATVIGAARERGALPYAAEEPARGVMAELERAGITFVSGVPDSGVKEIIASLEAGELDQRYVLATREDNAVALAVGAWLAGHQPLVFMESSGIGNAIDALTSLAIAHRVPLVLLVVWAGYKGRDVPHHNAIGEPLEALFESLSVPVLIARLKEPFPAMARRIAEAVEQANAERRPVAVVGIPPELDHD